MKLRISKQLEKKGIPAIIANKIRDIASSYPSGIKSFHLRPVTPEKVFHVGEGDRYYAIEPITKKEAGFKVVASHNIGGSDLSSMIGAEFSLPTGCWLININYYGKYHMTVYKIQKELSS